MSEATEKARCFPFLFAHAVCYFSTVLELSALFHRGKKKNNNNQKTIKSPTNSKNIINSFADLYLLTV